MCVSHASSTLRSLMAARMTYEAHAQTIQVRCSPLTAHRLYRIRCYMRASPAICAASFAMLSGSIGMSLCEHSPRSLSTPENAKTAPPLDRASLCANYCIYYFSMLLAPLAHKPEFSLISGLVCCWLAVSKLAHVFVAVSRRVVIVIVAVSARAHRMRGLDF